MAGLGIQNRGIGKARVLKRDGGPIVRPFVHFGVGMSHRTST